MLFCDLKIATVTEKMNNRYPATYFLCNVSDLHTQLQWSNKENHFRVYIYILKIDYGIWYELKSLHYFYYCERRYGRTTEVLNFNLCQVLILWPRSLALFYSWDAIFACMQNLYPCIKVHLLHVHMVLNKFRIKWQWLSKFNNGGLISIKEAEDFPLLCSSIFFVLG